jgi:hypothetical protein
MLEAIIVILGMCLIFVPVILYVRYLLTHVRQNTKFDDHLVVVRDKKGNFGVFIAYLERLLYGIVFISIGILFSEYFESEIAFVTVVISVTLYIIVKWIDEKNEK